ncbi:hypothetical protein [Candidatus Nitrospira bockiana]
MLAEAVDPQRLILSVLQDVETVTLEDLVEFLPELTWNTLFQAVDVLSRQGAIVLRRRGFAYHLSLPHFVKKSA